MWLVEATSAMNSQPHQHSPDPRPAPCDRVPNKERSMRLAAAAPAEDVRFQELGHNGAEK